jgi:hypothetical protein
MRKGAAVGLFFCLAFAFAFNPWIGTIGPGRVLAQQQPVPAPEPIPIPPQREKTCEDGAFARRGELPDRGCVARRDACPCASAACRPPEPDRCGAPCGGCGPAAERARDEPCRPPARGDGRTEAALPPKGPLPLAAFALYAERSLRLGRCGAVEGGGLGVRAPAKDDDKAQLRIGADGWIDPERLVAAPSVGLGDDVVVGLIATDRFRDNGVSLSVPAPFPVAQMPPLPLVPGVGGGPNVTVARDQALALQPGAYGTLGVEGVLALNPGIYRVDKVRVGDGGRIVAITGDVHLIVAGTFSVGRHAAIYPDFDLPARQFRISVAGYDASEGHPAASIGEQSRVRALLAAPHGSLSLADHVRATGAFAAFDIAAGEDVRVKFEDGFPGREPGQNGSQQLSGYLNAPILDAPVVGPVPASQVISLAIGLPAQSPAAMKQAAHDLADPTSPSFRKYLTPSQLAATYGAPQADYQAVVDWAQTHGLTVTATYPNRLLVGVNGTAEQIEQALYIGLDQRLRPDGSTFYALDRDPSIDLGVQLLWISGLDNRVLATHGGGSGPGGSYNAVNLRAAYASCTGTTGAGQTVGLFELDGYTPADIPAYECQLGGATCTPSGVVTSTVPNVTPVPVVTPTALPPTGGAIEVTLDIDMAIGVAPGLTQVSVFEAPNGGGTANSDLILAQMAKTQPLANQLSSSWFFGTDTNTQPAIYALLLQGQTFLQAAGDQGSNSWGTDPGDIRDLDGVTVVGGTALTLTGSPPAYGSETVWNIAGQGASGGGIATGAPIPTFQTGINTSTNGGSKVNRNLPDVSAVASNLGVIFTNPKTGIQAPGNQGGTSAAAPTWAGLIALANQLSASSPTGSGRVGDPNPFLYTVIANNASAYAASFNTFTSGNNNGVCVGQAGSNSAACNVLTGTSPTGLPIFTNTWTPGSGSYPAVTGYNLATGLGSPKCALLNELATGATTAIATNPATITYHQTGACNGFATSSGITSTGPNAAYVIFGIEKLDNSGGTAPFNFDPTKLYVQQAIQNFVDPGLQIYPNILGPFAAVATTVPTGQVISYSVSAQNALVVQTTNSNGATEANQTSYFLKYNASASDPTVQLTKSDASQTSWPDTEDCSTISLH